MPIIFHGQLDGYRSRSSGDRLVTFGTYEDNPGDINEIINSKIGSEFLIIAIPTADSKAMKEWTDESPAETLDRFRKHMNALIQDCAEIKGLDKAVFRESIKQKLKKDGLIKESTKELTLEGYATVIDRLKKLKYTYEH